MSSRQAPRTAAPASASTTVSTISSRKAMRASSRRSPMMVSVGKSSHSGTTSSMPRPPSHRTSPSRRAAPPMASTSTAALGARR